MIDEAKGVFTRLDLAIDDFKGYFNVDLIRRTFLDGRCISRFQHVSSMESYDGSSREKTMDSFYLGSMKSRLSINFYDKRLEREGAGKDVEVDEWTRTELRLKREYADMVASLFVFENGDVGKVALGVLKKYVRFIRENDVKNKSRVPVIKWWKDFLGNVEGVQLSVALPDRTIESTMKWLAHSVMPSLAMLRKANAKMFERFFEEEIEKASDRLSSVHKSMIENYRRSSVPEWLDTWKNGHKKRRVWVTRHTIFP